MSVTPRFLLILSSATVLLLTTNAFCQQTEPSTDPDDRHESIEQINREGGASESNRESGEDVRGREEWFTFQRRFPYDMIPAGMRQQAIRDTRALEQRQQDANRAFKRGGAVVQAANTWEAIGPANIGGRVRALAVEPGNPQVLYIGAAAGGVWKTTDGGANWKTTTDTLPSLAVGALAIDFNKHSTVFMGTGENTGNIDAYLGAGVFKSTDAGVTWKASGLETVGAVSKIFVHHQNSNIVYAATCKKNQGFYRSEDGGATWKRIVTGEIYDMSVNPNNSDEIYISSTNSIRHSIDAGKTFTVINSGLNLSGGLRISVAIAPAQTTRAYALVARDPGTGGNHIGEAYVTTNSGSSWQLLKQFDQSFFNQQGWYDNCIAVDPQDPNIVLAGGIDVYRSLDGGATWTNSTRSYFGGNVHPDQHILEFDPLNSGVVFLGDDGGVFGSVDAAGAWTRLSTKLPITQYYAMDIDQTKLYRAYGGSQDNGSHGSYGTTSFVTDWNSVLAGDGFYVVVDLTDPNTIYAEQFNGTPLYRIDANNTNNRTRIDGSISSDANTGDYGYWSTPIAMSPADKKTLYTGRSKLYRTSNRGSSWQSFTPGGPGKITAIGLSSFDSKKMAVGATDGLSSDVRYSINDGATWAKSAGIPNRFITDVVYDPVDQNRVYVSVSGSGAAHIYISEDNGATFTSIAGNLPNVPANAVAIDPRDNSHVFLGTDVGMFVSVDGGNYWAPFNDGLPLVPVIDLKIHTTSHVLFAATHGRSMFKVNITGVEVAPVLINPVGGTSMATPGVLPVRWAGLQGPVRIFISYDGGQTYHLIADSVSGSSDSLLLPIIRSNSVRIKVVELGGAGRSVESGDFSLTATLTGTDVGQKGFVAEAIEYRRGYLWATERGTDSIYVLKLQLLSPKTGLLRTGIPGHVIDMAYDNNTDRFYMLTAANDFSSPKLYRMDTNGVGQGEVALPAAITKANGVAMNNEGIAIMTPGAQGELYVINDSGRVLNHRGPLIGATEEERHGLVWDQLGYVQGVISPDPILIFPSELQHLSDDIPLRVQETAPVVLQNSQRVVFFGLAFDPSNPVVNQRVYWATDTTGTFIRFDRSTFFTTGVEAEPGVAAYTSREVSIGVITPNPLRGMSDIHFTLRSRRPVSVDLYNAAGTLVVPIFNGTMEAGDHVARLDGSGLASGVYYVAVSAGAGERDVRPVVVLK